MNFHTKLYLEVDSLKNLVWCIEFQEEHDEDAMVGNLAYDIISDDFSKHSLNKSNTKTILSERQRRLSQCKTHVLKSTCWNSVPLTS